MKRSAILVLAALIALSCFATSVNAAVAGPEIDCRAYILYNATDDVVLCEFNADERVYPASITKVMTAIVALESGALPSTVKVSSALLDGLYEQGSRIYLKAGEELASDDLMAYLLIVSSNDAANVIASAVAGDIPAFVSRMNVKAQELGMTGTSFSNPHGLHSESTYTTARDVLTMCVYAMKNDRFRELVGKASYDIPATNKQEAQTVYSTNFLLSGRVTGEYLYSAARGIKTGTTTPAGLCLASCAEIDGKLYYGVIMGANAEKRNSQFAGMITLFKFAPTAYLEQQLVDHTTPICQVPVRLGKDKDSVNVTPSKDYYAYLPNDFKMSDVEYKYDVKPSLDAPVEKGDVVGSITFTYGGREYVTMDLVADSNIEQSLALSIMDKVTDFFSSGFFKILVAVILLLLAVFLIWAFVINKNRRRKSRSRYKYGGYRKR